MFPTLTRATRALTLAAALGATALATTPVYAHIPEGGYADLVEQVSPAVVFIEVTGKARATSSASPFPPGSPFEEFFGRRAPGNERQQPPAHGLGSGYIISADGEIVTNQHVVDGATEVTVRLADGREFHADVVGSDKATDVALLKISGASDLPTVPFGDSDALRVGEAVVAVGNPFGLGGTVTVGVVSALGRDINSGPYDSYIQTDAAINRGNSGGPLFNEKGDVIGMNTAIFSPSGGSVGIGFSIPAKTVQQVVAQLRNGGEVKRGWLGVQIQQITPDIAEALGLNEPQGALVSAVQPDSPAAAAGFKQGDVILSVNDEAIEEMRELPQVIAAIAAGDEARVAVLRNGDERILDVTIGLLEPSRLTRASAPADAPLQADPLGVRVERLTPDLARQLGLAPETSGVLVAEVDPEGPNASKLRAGDVIEEAAGKNIASPADLDAVLSSSTDAAAVLLRINRGGNPLYVGADLTRS
ncbi:MAG: DegQ family serine endoprotease [Brevirhabdus sp.]